MARMQNELSRERPAEQAANREVETHFSVRPGPRGVRLLAYQLPRLTLAEAAEALPRVGNGSK